MSKPVLVARGLTRRFGARTAVEAVSLELGPGELLAVIGPNGAGKTTLLSMLAGVLAPTGGQISVGRTGWVPQQPALYRKLTVAENLRLFARLERLAEPEAAVRRMLNLTDLAAREEEPVARLSGGNQQRLNIAIGLLGSPSVLLLDEPSSSLDPRQRGRLWEFITGCAREGTGVVFSTHDVTEAERYGDRVLVLADGEPLFLGGPAELERAVERDAEGGSPGVRQVGQDANAWVPAGHRLSFEAAFLEFLAHRGH